MKATIHDDSTPNGSACLHRDAVTASSKSRNVLSESSEVGVVVNCDRDGKPRSEGLTHAKALPTRHPGGQFNDASGGVHRSGEADADSTNRSVR